MVRLAHDGGDLLPLILRRVDAGGVVRAGVQEDYGAAGCGPDGVEHAIDIQALGCGGEVRVGGGAEVDV